MTVTEQLWRAHAQDVQRFLERRVARPQDAEDLLQEVFLRATRTPPNTAAPAWLFTVARTVLADHYRRAHHHREALTDSVPEEQAEAAPEPDLVGPRAARCAANMIDRLPGEQAEALRHVDMAAARQNKVAQAAGISLSGMKSRVQRGRTALRGLVETCCRITQDRRGAVIAMTPNQGGCRC